MINDAGKHRVNEWNTTVILSESLRGFRAWLPRTVLLRHTLKREDERVAIRGGMGGQ